MPDRVELAEAESHCMACDTLRMQSEEQSVDCKHTGWNNHSTFESSQRPAKRPSRIQQNNLAQAWWSSCYSKGFREATAKLRTSTLCRRLA